jgi:hypothetical protein
MLGAVEQVRAELRLASSPVLLGYRHAATQPEPHVETTGSVRAMIVSRMERVAGPTRGWARQAPWLVAAMLAGAMIGVVTARTRAPAPAPLAAPAARIAEAPRALAQPEPRPSATAPASEKPLAPAPIVSAPAKQQLERPPAPTPFSDYKDSPY